MIQKLEILDENLNKLDEINNMSFSFENFNKSIYKLIDKSFGKYSKRKN